MNLKQILDSATPGPWEHWRDDGSEGFYVGERGKGYVVNMGAQYADARLIALAPELAALVLDMGEELRKQQQGCGMCGGSSWLDYGRCYCARSLDLLARLDQLGVREDSQLGKEPA